MKIKSEKDFWSGLMFVAVGVAFAVGATNYSFGGACERVPDATAWDCLALASARPGPGYFPFGLGILMALLGAIVVFQALTFEVEGGDKIGPWAWRPLFMVTATVAAFGVLLPQLGMIATLPVLVVVASLAGGEFRWKDAALNAAVLTAGSWFIFIYGLKLTIPLWPSFLGR